MLSNWNPPFVDVVARLCDAAIVTSTPSIGKPVVSRTTPAIFREPGFSGAALTTTAGSRAGGSCAARDRKPRQLTAVNAAPASRICIPICTPIFDACRDRPAGGIFPGAVGFSGVANPDRVASRRLRHPRRGGSRCTSRVADARNVTRDVRRPATGLPASLGRRRAGVDATRHALARSRGGTKGSRACVGRRARRATRRIPQPRSTIRGAASRGRQNGGVRRQSPTGGAR